jgi:hypothetical protein
MRGPLFQITTFIETTATRTEETELPLRLEEAFPIIMPNYHSFFNVEATGICTPIGNSEILLASVYINICTVPGVLLISLSS